MAASRRCGRHGTGSMEPRSSSMRYWNRCYAATRVRPTSAKLCSYPAKQCSGAGPGTGDFGPRRVVQDYWHESGVIHVKE
jgi:hypothetical protein